MFARLRFPASVFYVISLLVLPVIHFSSAGNVWRLLGGLFLMGFAVGFSVQILVREAIPLLRISVASFAAAFTLWLPVVLLSYGFGLMATPLVAGYGAIVGLGAPR